MNRRAVTVCMIIALLIALSCPAYAQTGIDMRPLATSALEWIAMALTAVLTLLGGIAVRYVSARIGLTNSELERSLVDRLNNIIHMGIDRAHIAALNEVNNPGSGLTQVKIDNLFLSMAASYVNRSAPEIIKKFGLTQQRIEEMIIARLPAYMDSIPVAGGLPTPDELKPTNG